MNDNLVFCFWGEKVNIFDECKGNVLEDKSCKIVILFIVKEWVFFWYVLLNYGKSFWGLGVMGFL